MTLYSEDENIFLVHISAGHVLKFIRGTSPCLYYFNSGNIHISKLKLALSMLGDRSEEHTLY